MAEPWTDGGYTYASDGCLILRTKARANSQPANNPITASADKMFAEQPAPAANKFRPLSPEMTDEPAELPCEECRGNGAVLDAKDNPILCPSCEGTKTIRNRKRIPVGNAFFAAYLLARIATLPGLRIVPPTRAGAHPMRFAFDHGEGLLMPLNPDV